MSKTNSYAERIRKSGYKLTNARMTVLEVIEESGGHVTSNEVMNRVNAADPSIGRASVFRALDLLTRLNIVRPTYAESSMTPSYVLMPGGHHHHIVCANCSKIVHFEDCGLDQLTNKLQDRYNVVITGHLLEFYGVCADCRK